MEIDKRNGKDKPGKLCGIYCIYNSKYFYIGLSSNIKSRWNDRRSKLKRGVHDNIFMQNVYNKHFIDDPFMYKVICTCERRDLGTLEKNIFEEYCKKYSDKIPMNIANCGQTNTWTENMKLKASKSHTGIKFSKQHRNAISKGQKGKTRQKQRIPVVQLTLDGKFIRVWSSIQEVGKELGININYSRKSSGGFQWQKYSDWKINPKGPVEYHTTKTVFQYAKNGAFIRKYNSIQEASDITGIKHCNISNTITGIQKSAGGFIWSLK